MKRPWLACLLVGVGCAGLTPRAQAQTAPDDTYEKMARSHRLDLDLFGPPSADLEDDLLKRLRGNQLLEALKKQQFDPAMLDALKKYPNLLDQFKELNLEALEKGDIQNAFKGMPDLAAPADTRQGWEQLKQKLQEDLKKEADAAANRTEPGPGPRPALPAPIPGATEPPPDANLKPWVPGAANAQGRSMDASFGQQVAGFAERMQRYMPSLRESPALQSAVRDLSRSIGADDPRWASLANGANQFQAKWNDWTGGLHLDRLAPKQGLSWLDRLAPRLPQMRGSGGPSGSPGSFGLPRVGAPSVSGGSGWQPLAAVIGLALGGFLLWMLLAARQAETETDKKRWRLGPWPVNPAQIVTREEFITAFEYLALRNLGYPARHWNHLFIASQLGTETGANAGPKAPHSADESDPISHKRRNAAEQLSQLYEQARYAPRSDPLPEDALVEARTALCLLAGVPAA